MLTYFLRGCAVFISCVIAFFVIVLLLAHGTCAPGMTC